MLNPNPLKKLLKEGKTALGGWITLEGELKTEVFAKGGFDWMTIDLQHGALTLESARPLITAIESSGSNPLIRVPWNDPSMIMRALDAGAYGIFVPLVNSAEEAAARADLRQHSETLNVNQIGANLEAVERMYDIWEGRIQ